MQHRIPRRTFLAAAIGTPFLATHARAADGPWPQRPVRVLIGFAPGGQVDGFARVYGEHVTQQTGQPWTLDFKPGANQTLAVLDVKRAAPDGHTLLFATSTVLIQHRVTFRTLPYDPDKDLSLVSFMPSGNLPVIVSTARTGATNLREFVEHVRRTPKASVGTYGAGTHAHILFSELNRQYGLDMSIVHYRNSVQMWTDVGSGVLDAGIASYQGALPFLQKGVARVVGTVPDRLAPLPAVASCAEQGAASPAFRIGGYLCCVAPGGTPPAVVERISAFFQEAARTERVRAMLAQFGVEQGPLTTTESRRRYEAEMPVWLALVKELGLTPE